MLSLKDLKPPFNTMEYKRKMKKELERIPGVKIPEEKFDKYPTIGVFALEKREHLDIFTETIKSYMKDIDKLTEQ